MKKSHYIYSSLIVVLVFFNLLEKRSFRKSFAEQKYQFESLLEREKTLSKQRDYFSALEIKNNNSILDKKKFVLTNEKGDKSFLENHLTSKKLIFRYSELHCSICVDKQIEALNKFIKSVGSENILILANYDMLKSLIIFKRLNSLEVPIYKLSEKLNLEIEENDVPYFFILDENALAQDFFIPIKEIENYTDNYLKTISDKYFKK